MIEQFNFYSAQAHLYEFFGIDLPDDSFEEIGLHGWDKIGNKRTRFYKYRGKVVNGFLKLPCNVDIIESVTIDSVDYTKTIDKVAENHMRDHVESFIEYNTETDSHSYVSGSLVDYEIDYELNGLLFKNCNNHMITVLYKGLIVDENGLPFLNFKEKEAIAIYCAWVHTMKQGMITKDKGTIELAMLLQARWNKACSNARSPIKLNQNDMDEILEVQHSWDRKTYGISFKPVR